MMIYGAIIIILFGVFIFFFKGHREFYRQKKIWTFFLLLLPLGTLGLYFLIGSPEYLDQPHAKLQKNVERLRQKSPEALIQEFRDKLSENDSPQARHFLGQTLIKMGRFEEGLKEIEQAYKLSEGKNSAINLSYAEVLISKNNGIVKQKSFDLMSNVLKENPKNPICMFYMGLYHFQNKQSNKGAKFWKDLIANADGADWKTQMLVNLKQVAQENHIELSKYDIILPQIPQEEPPAFTKEQKDMITQMVERLREKQKQNPNDEALKARLKEVEAKYKMIMQN